MYATVLSRASPLCSTPLLNRCNGGHLASFESFSEQVEVEANFTAEGMLMPKFHRHYWMGLRTTEEEWPVFGWVQKLQAAGVLSMQCAHDVLASAS